jgi:deazaflavin-dependent oxidoreductase (nitroreductase family)
MSRWPKALMAVGGAALGAALIVPSSRKQMARAARMVLDEVALQADTPLTQGLVILTSEGRQTHLPRTTVLSQVELDGEKYVMPWVRSAGWYHNVVANPDVVVDDRVRVHRAQAEVVNGETADRVRQELLERYMMPGALRTAIDRQDLLLAQGLPAIRLVTG